MKITRTERTRTAWQLIALVGLLPVASLVAAHAFLQRATPGADSTVHESPAQIKLWFSERIEPAFSSVEVVDADHKRIDKGDSRVDSGDSKLLQISLPRLAPGTYHVTWRVLSIDTHVAKGEFNFAVAP